MDIKDAMIIVGLFVNFVGVLFAVFSSRIIIERRLTRVETRVAIIVRNCKNCDRSNMRERDYSVLNDMAHSSNAS